MYGIYRLAQWLSTSLPYPVARVLAQCLADVQYGCSGVIRRNVSENLALLLRQAVPEDSPWVNEVFRNFNRYVLEFFSVHHIATLDVILEHEEYLHEARRQGKGAIILSAHLGNWEVGAVFIRRMGFPMSAVALPHAQPRLDRLFNEQRRRCGIDVIPLGAQATRQSLQCLREGQWLGVLGDWVVAGSGVSVSFCGREQLFPVGPALLSLRAQVPIVPVFLIREGDWKFRFLVDEPIRPPENSGKERVVYDLVSRYVASMERCLLQAPTQWLLFQPLRSHTLSPWPTRVRNHDGVV